MDRYSAYEFLAYLLPGGAVIFAAWVGAEGWPSAEPGPTGLIFILAASFFVGQAVAAMASWLEPVLWGHQPYTPRDPTWGLFGEGRRYEDAERDDLLTELRSHVGSGDADFAGAYRLGYTRLQQAGHDGHLRVLNQQIAFHRNSALSMLSAAVIHVGLLLAGQASSPSWWAALYCAAAIIFAGRYRRFYVEFGDNVIRGIRLLPS
jgi:hypothetical protein